MSEWLATEDVARLEERDLRTVQRWLAEGFYHNVRWDAARGGNGGKRALIHWTALSPEARQRWLEEQAGRPGTVDANLRALLEAPARARETAHARLDLLELIERQVSRLREADPGLSIKRAGAMVLGSYNAGVLDPKLLARLGQVSVASLYRWRQRHREGKLAGLLPGHGGGRQSALTTEMKAAIGGILLQRLLPPALVYRLLRPQFGRALPHQKTVQRFCLEWTTAHARDLNMEQAPTFYKRRLQPSLGQADRAAAGPNDIWEIDSTRADIILADGRRRIGINVIDVFSRRVIIGIWEKDNAWAVCQTLRKAFLAFGLPNRLRMDNGLNYYQSSLVQRVCAELEIEVVKLPPYRPDKKPFTERLFGTWQGQLLRLLPGYTEHSVAKRPEIVIPGIGPEELQEKTDRWLEGTYEETVHSETEQRPRERFHQPGFRPKMVSDVRDLDILLMPVARHPKVTAACIQFDNAVFTCLELAAWEGQKVEVRQPPEDAAALIVRSIEQPGKKPDFIGIAVCPERKGWTVEQIKRYQATLRKADRLEHEALKLRLDMTPIYPDRVEAMLDQGMEQKPAVIQPKADVIELPVSYRQAAEALEEAAAEEQPAEPLAGHLRPKLWDSELQRYEWLIEERALGGEIGTEDTAFMARFEGSSLYAELRSSLVSWEEHLRNQQLMRSNG